MRLLLLFLVGLFGVATTSAQTSKSFVSKEMAFSTELFPKSETNVEIPRLLEMTRLSSSYKDKTNLASLPENYSWAKEINRSQSIRKASFETYQIDALGRSPLPDASRNATQQVQMRSAD